MTREINVEGFIEIMARTLESFSKLSYNIHEMVAEDDRVMLRMTYSGVHDGEFFGIEPTGNRFEVEQYLVFRLADGKIVENRWLGDYLGLFKQLDVQLPIE